MIWLQFSWIFETCFMAYYMIYPAKSSMHWWKEHVFCSHRMKCSIDINYIHLVKSVCWFFSFSWSALFCKRSVQVLHYYCIGTLILFLHPLTFVLNSKCPSIEWLYSSHIFLLNWSLNHYVITFFVYFNSVCIQVYFMILTLWYLCWWGVLLLASLYLLIGDFKSFIFKDIFDNWQFVLSFSINIPIFLLCISLYWYFRIFSAFVFFHNDVFFCISVYHILKYYI